MSAPDAQASEGAVGEAANPRAFPTQHNGCGMTLRDWFAGQALVEMASLIQVTNPRTYDVVAGIAYELADAMLRARLPAAAVADTEHVAKAIAKAAGADWPQDAGRYRAFAAAAVAAVEGE